MVRTLAVVGLMLMVVGWGAEAAPEGAPPAPIEEAPAGTEEATPEPALEREAQEAAPTPEGEGETSAPIRWSVTNVQWTGRVDFQVVNMREPGLSTTTGQLMAAEIESTATITNGRRDVLDLALQWPYYTAMEGPDDRGREMHFGSAYGIYKFGLGRPNLRFGQFVVPFGNLTYYETHTRPLQSLYGQSLGIRIDRGVSLEGIRGDYDYWLALVGGNGARSDNNHRPVLAAKAQRRFDLPSGILTAGASLLHGTEMPRFSPLVDPVMHGGEHMLMDGMERPSFDFVTKTRLGLDAEYSIGPALYRAELIAGRDSDGSVNGQFLQWNRTLDERHEVTAQLARWEQPTGTRTRYGAMVARQLADRTTVRLAAERSLGHTPMVDRNETMISIQLLREFPRLFGR